MASSDVNSSRVIGARKLPTRIRVVIAVQAVARGKASRWRCHNGATCNRPAYR